MMSTVNRYTLLSLFLGATACAPAPVAQAPVPVVTPAETVHVAVDTVAAMSMVPDTALRAGRFDNGKMWTFEYPPLDYFREAYGFAPDSAWFRTARLGALRLPNCTASFVSADGLVLTNHHCARESVVEVTRPGERLLDDGFYAATLADERPVDGLYVDQLIAIRDVTAAVDSASDAEREQVSDQISQRIAEEFGGAAKGIVVEMVSLWNGARTSAYVFRRFSHLRLVMTPEIQVAYFGGDPDNFTYPRYDLDMSFFRVYTEDGQPYHPDVYFPMSRQGIGEGDPVFVIGNPGSTSRLQTVAELEYRRLVGDKTILDFLRSRIAALQAYAALDSAGAAAMDLRNTIFGLSNSEKAYTGMWQGLGDPVIMARRRDAQRAFQDSIAAHPVLERKYGDLFSRMAHIQEQKIALGADFGAFIGLGSQSLTSATLRRAIRAYQYLSARSSGAPAQALSGMANQLRAVGQQPLALQQQLLTARLSDFERAFGDTSQIVAGILAGRAPQAAARALLAASPLVDSARAVAALDADSLTMSDPVVQLIATIFPRYRAFGGTFSQLGQEEQSVGRAIGRAHFDVYGTTEPPDATFSLRIADGVVRGYPYNGTVAPIHTTFFGMYDRYYSFGGGDWDLPARWRTPPADFDRTTPLDFVSTADIIGGNSGSPVLNRKLELVGLIFDGNIESLPGDYIYLPSINRAVAVDARAIVEALRHVYRADRLVRELTGTAATGPAR
jgi:hypothetical protein